MIPLLLAGLGLASLAFLQGCGESTPDQKIPEGPSPTSHPDGKEITYYQQVKPILDAKCAPCHTHGPGPIRITNFDEAYLYRGLINAAVQTRAMPPWPPAPDCTPEGYVGDRSLSPDQISLISAWVQGGAVEGDPQNPASPLPSETLALSRIDRSLSMVTPYTPDFSTRPDDYRCFVLDWPETTTKFVTGFNMGPGDVDLVHHVIAYLIEPDSASAYPVDPQGYECFGGGPGRVLAAWAPGTQGRDFPPGTGIRVEPGSKVALQMHYHSHAAAQNPLPTDQSRMEVRLENSVTKEAENRFMMDLALNIPDGQADAVHQFSNDLGENLLLYGALLHMHRLGTKISLTRKNGTASECLLNIPNWNFHWQDMYFFAKGPKAISADDSLQVECHWNNTEAFRQTLEPPAPPGDRHFGEGSDDEMCLGILYLTK